MVFIVATNVVASRPPERRPTWTPHARAKILVKKSDQEDFLIIDNFESRRNLDNLELKCGPAEPNLLRFEVSVVLQVVSECHRRRKADISLSCVISPPLFITIRMQWCKKCLQLSWEVRFYQLLDFID